MNVWLYMKRGRSDRMKYEIRKGKIIFRDENAWTADFDDNLILHGEYDLDRDRRRVWLHKTVQGHGSFEYALERQ